MLKSEAKRGRPLQFPRRMLLATDDEMVAAVDTWRETQPDRPSRSEAIRRLVERGLKSPIAFAPDDAS